MFLGVLKKEDQNKEEYVTPDNLEISDLSPDSIPEKNQDEGDSDPEIRELEGETRLAVNRVKP